MITLIIALAGSLETISPASDATQGQMKAFESCVVRSARFFARSPDAADIIATAALESCEAEKKAFLASQRTPDGQKIGIRYLRALDQALNEKVRAKAILAITEVRARTRR